MKQLKSTIPFYSETKASICVFKSTNQDLVDAAINGLCSHFEIAIEDTHTVIDYYNNIQVWVASWGVSMALAKQMAFFCRGLEYGWFSKQNEWMRHSYDDSEHMRKIESGYYQEMAAGSDDGSEIALHPWKALDPQNPTERI